MINQNSPEEDNLSKEVYKEIVDNNSKNIIEKIINSLYMIGFNIVLVIIIYSICFSNNKAYKAFKDEVESNISSTYEKFWCNFGVIENGILISYLVLLILLLIFKILSLLIHKFIIKIRIGEGILYYIFIILNSFFSFIFSLYCSFIIGLLVGACFISFLSPLEVREEETGGNAAYNNTKTREKTKLEKKWDEQLNAFFYFILLLILFLFNYYFYFKIDISNSYVNLHFEDYGQNIPYEERAKNIKINFNNRVYDGKMKTKYLILFPYKKAKKSKKESNDPIVFLIISINNLTEGFIYILLDKDNYSIIELLPIDNNIVKTIIYDMMVEKIDIDILEKKRIVNKQSKIFLGQDIEFIYNFLNFIFCTIICLFKCHLSNESNYDKLLEKKKNYLIKYPSLEKGITNSRFCLYIIFYIILFLIQLKRKCMGGISKYKYLKIAYALSFIFLFINIIYIILTVILIYFSIKCYYVFENSNYYMIKKKFIAQIILNIFAALELIILFVFNIILISNLTLFKKEYQNVSTNEISNNNNSKKYKYLNLDNNICYLQEFNIQNFPKCKIYKKTDENANNEDGALNNRNISRNSNNSSPQNGNINNQINNNDNITKTNQKIDINNEISRRLNTDYINGDLSVHTQLTESAKLNTNK